MHLSEHAAYGRIEAARAVRRLPAVLDRLAVADGSMTLTAVCLLAPHLTPENHQAVLSAAMHKSKREVELQVAALRPLPPAPSIVRKLPSPRTAPACGESDTARPRDPEAAPHPSPAHRAVVTPLAPEQYKIQITVSRETHDKLQRVQDLLRHAVPNGDPAVIVDRALTVLLAHLEKTKLAATQRPKRPGAPPNRPSRCVPAGVKREVWKRDGGRCAFVGSEGRCAERGFLEFHHVMPFADGGETTAANLQLRCRAHNAHEALLQFGPMCARERAPAYER